MAKSMSLENEILGELIQDIEEVASNEIDDIYKDKFVRTAVDKWYNTYSVFYKHSYPIIYKRRYTNKGLIDERKMITEINNNGTSIEVKFYSDAKTNPYKNNQPIYPSLESDENLVDYLAEEVYPSARRVDLIEETENALDKEEEVEKALEIGLKRKGYDIK